MNQMPLNQPSTPSVGAPKPGVIASGMQQKFRPGLGVTNWLSAIFVIAGILVVILVLLFVR